MESVPGSDERDKGDPWLALPTEEAKALYEEATKVAFYFSDWRHKILTYFLAFATVLAAATQWIDRSYPDSRIVAIPFTVGCFVSLMLAWMDYRNMLLLRIAHGVAASIERQWGVGPVPGKWKYAGGHASSGFYSALAELQPFRRTAAWTRWQRMSSYSVTMPVFLLAAASAFGVGAAVVFACAN
jgi:hypothetical protein